MLSDYSDMHYIWGSSQKPTELTDVWLQIFKFIYMELIVYICMVFSRIPYLFFNIISEIDCWFLGNSSKRNIKGKDILITGVEIIKDFL